MAPSEEIAANICKAAWRMQASAYDSLVVRYRAYPMRLVDIVSGDQTTKDKGMQELLTAPLCTLDEFALEIRRRWPDITSLSAADAQMELLVFLNSIAGTTFSTERLHSKTGRRVRSRVMTRRVGIKDIAAAHTGHVAPSWFHEQCQRQWLQDERLRRRSLCTKPKKKKKKEAVEELGVHS